MAYASKYYDPVKAHEYYMRTRELKGYENRYGGSRGNGTSAASGGVTSTSSTRSTPKYPADKTREHNQNVQRQIQSVKAESAKRISNINSQIQGLRNRLNSMSPEDRRANRESINDQIHQLRRQIQSVRNAQLDSVQSLRENTKGGSTSGFNQKGKEAAAFIKKKMEDERQELTKKTNKELDNKMLDEVKRLQADMKAIRESGRGFSRQQFRNRIQRMLGKTKSMKSKMLAKHKAEYRQKYVDEIDKLRKDKSMYTYYEKRTERLKKQAASEARYQQRKAERAERKRQQEAARAARAARAASRSSGGSSSGSGGRRGRTSKYADNWWNSAAGLDWKMRDSIAAWKKIPNSEGRIEFSKNYFTEAKRMLRDTGSWDDETVRRRLGLLS